MAYPCSMCPLSELSVSPICACSLNWEQLPWAWLFSLPIFCSGDGSKHRGDSDWLNITSAILGLRHQSSNYVKVSRLQKAPAHINKLRSNSSAVIYICKHPHKPIKHGTTPQLSSSTKPTEIRKNKIQPRMNSSGQHDEYINSITVSPNLNVMQQWEASTPPAAQNNQYYQMNRLQDNLW